MKLGAFKKMGLYFQFTTNIIGKYGDNKPLVIKAYQTWPFMSSKFGSKVIYHEK